MGYPSCRDFSQVRSSRTILSAVPTELSHLSLSHILRVVICGSSLVSFFTNSTVYSFLAETGRPPTVTILTFPAFNLSNHLQTLLYKKTSKQKNWLHMHLSNQNGISSERLSASSVWAHRNKIAQLLNPFSFFRHHWWHHIFNYFLQSHDWWRQYNFVHGKRVRCKVSPDAGVQYVTYIIYKSFSWCRCSVCDLYSLQKFLLMQVFSMWLI